MPAYICQFATSGTPATRPPISRATAAVRSSVVPSGMSITICSSLLLSNGSIFTRTTFTKNSDIPIAKSIVDYIFRWLGIKFLGHHPVSTAHEAAKEDLFEAGGVKPVADTQLSLINGGAGAPGGVKPESPEDRAFLSETDAPPCSECGSIMVRRGACYACLNCGTTSGCS